MNEYVIRQLACAVILQAVEDYFRSSKEKKRAILKDLRSNWMQIFTQGTSANVAEQLELRPEEIHQRMKKKYRGVLI